MNKAFTLGIRDGKRLSYHQPGAVKPKVNLFDRTPASYGKSKIIAARQGGIGKRGELAGAGLNHWTGPYGGPATNGTDDFLSDHEREVRRKAKRAPAPHEVERAIFDHIRRKDLQLHVVDGPRLRALNADKYRLLSGHVSRDGCLTRTTALPSAIVQYPALPPQGARFYRTKVKE